MVSENYLFGMRKLLGKKGRLVLDPCGHSYIGRKNPIAMQSSLSQSNTVIHW